MVWPGTTKDLRTLDIYFVAAETHRAVKIGDDVEVTDPFPEAEPVRRLVWNGAGYGVAWL